MTEIREIFRDLGISEYLDLFVENGFDTWETILDITEPDFDALGVKLGHRRKLQRRIANSRGLSSDQALVSPTRNTSIDDRQSEDQSGVPSQLESRDGGHSSGKRKYRRHPKPDENAPERPPSAYVVFSNKMRVDLKGRNLSFTEIAKLVGENWQNLSPQEKEPHEAEAFRAKEKYSNELAGYKRTEEYKKYAEYLADFKEKQTKLHNATDPSKRPRIEHQTSTGSSATGSSADSQHGANGVPTPRRGGGSTTSSTASRLSFVGGQSISGKSFPIPVMTSIQDATARSIEQASPAPTSSGLLPGYRDSIVGAQQQKLAWRDGNSRAPDVSSPPQASQTSNGSERSSHPPAEAKSNHSSRFGARSQKRYRTGSSFSPPTLLTSESMSSTSVSSNCSSLHHMPRTSAEPPFERQISITPLYVSQPQDNQLPPIRAVSLSPQLSIDVSYNSPTGVLPMEQTLTPVPRGHVSASQTPMGFTGAVGNAGRTLSHNRDEILDPVSALLKADEIVNRAGRNRQPI